MDVPALPRLHILVVEDNPDSAISLALLLRMYGHEVKIARNGSEALEKIRETQPEVVLLDIGLPGMSGYEVARHLNEQRPRKTPLLVAVTGYGQDSDRERSAEVGIDLHLVKPVDPSYLQRILARFQQMIREDSSTQREFRVPLPVAERIEAGTPRSVWQFEQDSP